MRACDGGVALRYEFPRQQAMPTFRLMHERTRFRFVRDSTCWAAKYKGFVSHQEEYFLKTRLSQIAPGDGVTLVSRLARQQGRKNVVPAESPKPTPWRVIMVARQPVTLLENDMVLSLNAPCAIENPRWIEPGMTAWDHWWSGDVKMNTATIKQYIQP